MTNNKKSYLFSMVTIGILFFIMGFITWVNGTLIPYLKIACELETELQSYLVATAFFIAYTLMALPSSVVLGKIGYKKGMSLALLVMAVGTFIFVPAAMTRNFNMFLIGLFIIGTGLALLQTAVNPYVSIIGPIESAATRISFMGIANKVAGILAGLIFGYIALSDVDGLETSLASMSQVEKTAKLDELASRVINPYYVITGLLVLLAIVIYKSSLPEIDDSEGENDTSNELASESRSSVFQFPHLLLGVLALFLYVGVEVIAGDTIISYGKSLGIELSVARYFTQFTLAGMLVGYIIGIFAIPKYISQSRALAICAITGVVFSVGALLTDQYVSVAFIALLGLSNSLMWPAIFPLAINKLGRFTRTGSAMLVMGISGGALLPLVYGSLADIIDSQTAYLILLPGYAFIYFYAVKGHKVGLESGQVKK